MKYNLPFTTDQFHRVMTNLSVTTHRFWYRNKVDFTENDRNDLYQAIEDVRDITYQLYGVYASQFNHSCMVRKICPNTDCHGVYAIFWTDWEYCPRCGTKLKITRDDREEVSDELRRL